MRFLLNDRFAIRGIRAGRIGVRATRFLVGFSDLAVDRGLVGLHAGRIGRGPVVVRSKSGS